MTSHSGTCINDDSGSQWKSEKFDPRSPLSPETLNRSSPNFAWVITSGTHIPTQTFITIRLPLFVPQICENSHYVTRLVVLGFFRQRTAKTPAPIFYDQYIKRRRFARGCAFSGSRKQNFIFRPHFRHKTETLSQFLTGLEKFSAQKGLNNGDGHL